MKRKILACVLACATLFLGMGYAFWSNSLQINTTADTGELKVKFVDMALFGQYGDEEKGWAIDNGVPTNPAKANNFFSRSDVNAPFEMVDMTAYLNSIKGYTKTSFTCGLENPTGTVPAGADDAYGTATKTSDSIKVDLTDIYPGYAQLFRTDIINVGTLAAKLADMNLTMGGDNLTMKDMIGVSLDVKSETGNFIRVLDTNDTNKFFTVGGQKFIRLSALDKNMIKDKTNGDDLLYIYPGVNTMDAYFGIAMDPDYSGKYTTGHVGLANPQGTDANSQNLDASFTIKFFWDQFNTPNPTPTH